MSNNQPVLITGAQRSGTTLVNLVLDSHPAVTGVDEMDFGLDALETYLSDERYHPVVAFKLPNYAHGLLEFPAIEDMKVLWCLRDPRDVVASMLRYEFGTYFGRSVSWANHPFGAAFDTYYCAIALSRFTQVPVMTLLGHYPQIAVKPFHCRSHQDAVYTAALCWKLKNALLTHYQASGMNIKAVKYEQLTRSPEPVLTGILDFLGIPWHDDVMHHHKLHRGRSVGNTENTRPIDDKSQGKWRDVLNDKDITIIKNLCGTTASELGYDVFNQDPGQV